jgi:glycosyltransferase involved in cell wall biosynthesis
MCSNSDKFPFVSVLLCVYNGEPYISAAIESVLQQTFTDFELVIINDGSRDRTRVILDEFVKKDPRVRVVHQENAGLTRALNAGLALCRGRWIARQDDDDISLPCRLEKQVEYVRSNEGVGLLGTACDVIDVEGNVLSMQEVPFLSSHQSLCRELQCRNPFVHTSVMFKRELVLNIGGYDEAYPAAEDYECWLRMSNVTQLAQLPEKLVQRRISPQMICKQNSKKQRQSVLRAKWNHGVYATTNCKVWFFIFCDIYRVVTG